MWFVWIGCAQHPGGGPDLGQDSGGEGPGGTSAETGTLPVDPGPDADGDGFHADVDCDDADATVFPGAPDVCGDDRVTNCDRTSDDGLVNLRGVGYDDLASALAAAVAGDELVLCPGTYTGTFEATAPVTLAALQDATTTTLAGDGSTTLRVPGGTTVRGLTVRDGKGVNGGGVQITSAGEVVFEGCALTRNDAAYGGGLFVGPGAVARLVDTSVSLNFATGGGGVAVAEGGTLDLSEGGEVVNNEADQWGGGVWLDSADLVGGVVSRNESWGYSYVYYYYGLPDLGDVGYGGAGVAATGVSDLTGVDVSSNNGVYGGGVSAAGGSLTLTDTVVSANVAYQLAGGLAAWGTDVALLGTSRIEGNIGGEGAGGVLVAFGTLAGGEVVDNLGGEYAGGVLAAMSSVTEVVIADNDAEYGVGGGVLSVGEVVLTDCAITGNLAESGGGVSDAHETDGVDGANQALEIVGGTISGNTALRRGGGLYLFQSVRLTGAEVSDNTANSGGGFLVEGGSALVDGGALLRNASATTGGGAQVEGGELAFVGVDFGLGADENTPDDLGVAAGVQYAGYGLGASATCTADGCSAP